MEQLVIGGLTAARGEKVSGFVPVGATGVGLPVTIICGEEDGETVLISGGVHNAEYVGIQSAIQLAKELTPDKIRGNVVMIHLMNPTGFEHRTMSLVYEDGKNLNRVFPGGPHGTMAEKIAFTVEQEFFTKADYYIDLHCGDGFEGLVSYVYCLGNADDYVVKKSREMAEIAHVDYLVVSSSNTGGAYNYAGSLGIPSVLLERGHSSQWCQKLVDEDVHDVKNMLRYLGVFNGKAHRHAHTPIDVSPVIYENAPVAGCWYPSKQPGDTFREGEVLGVIRDYFGKELARCTAKMDGIIMYETISLCIIKDSPMIAYGAWDFTAHGPVSNACIVCGQHEHRSGWHAHPVRIS